MASQPPELLSPSPLAPPDAWVCPDDRQLALRGRYVPEKPDKIKLVGCRARTFKKLRGDRYLIFLRKHAKIY